MSIDKFILRLRNADIELQLKDGRLICNAPKGVMSQKLRMDIQSRKAEIITFLNSAQPNGDSRDHANLCTVLIPAKPPLSFSQQRMWFFARFEPTSVIHNLPTACRISGHLSVDSFQEALNNLVKRHVSIRTTFGWDGENPYQIVATDMSLNLRLTDLSDYPLQDREKELARLLESEATQNFNLMEGPLLRVRLFKLSETEHVFFFMPHHAIWDGFSFDIFYRDIDALYKSALDGEHHNLPDLPVSYINYSVWQKEMLSDHAYKKLIGYWSEKLAGEIPPLELPSDRSRPMLMDYTGDRIDLTPPEYLRKALSHLAHSEGATLYMVILAAFNVLLYRYTGQTDIPIGSPIQGRTIQGRTITEIENLIGFFVNTIVLRTKIDPNFTFLDFLRQTKETCLGAYEHQDMPFEKIVEELNPVRDLSRTPLFQAMFTYQDSSQRRYKMAELELTKIVVNKRESPTDIHFCLDIYKDKISFGFEYCISIFDQTTIGRFANNFMELLKSIIADPATLIANLLIVAPEEKEIIWAKWNDTSRPYPEHLSLPELFEAQVEKTPDAIAAVFEQETITYRDLNARANQLARRLKGLGVGPERLVGIYVERSLSMLVGLLGIFKAGGAYVPLDPLFPKERLSFMLTDAGVSVLVTQESLADELPRAAGVLAVCLDAGWPEISRESGDNLSEKTRPEHPAYVIYTSGSTGLPKGVEITHRALVNFLCSMRDEPGIAADDVLLAVTTLSFDIAGLELYVPLIAGARVVIASHAVAADGIRLRELLESSKATIMQATPITWRMLLEAGWRGSRGLKILCGGEAFPAELTGPLLERGAEVWNMYGPTETTIWSTVYRIRDKDGPVLIGRPIANTSMYILDDHMIPVPIGVAGELYIGGDGLARGYLNRPELTAERFVTHAFKDNHQERLYKTGDLARYCHDGDIECLGRADFQVKIRGYRIELEEIEAMLQKHPAVRSAVVAARDAGGGDKRLVAYLICEPAAAQPSAQALREQARTTLPAYMIPSAYVFLDRFPLTPNGKIDRRALPAADAGSQADESELYSPPRNAIEMTIASVWQSLLQVKRVGIYDSFFDLGGHSLLAVQLFARLEKIFHKQLPLATLFEAPTVEKLAAVIESKDWKPSWASVVPIQPGGSKRPFFCIHGAGGNVLLYRDLARHMGTDQPFYGLQAKGLDGKQPFNTSIEAMASDYLKEIREIQSEAPYYLGGYCLGGVIAFEMARQLVQQGQTVAVLAMFDTQRQFKTDFKLLVKWYHRYQQIAFHIGNFLQADMQGKRGFLLEKASEAGRRIRRRYDIARSEIAYALKLRVDKPLVLMDKINDNASIAYQPAPYPGRVALFKPCRAYAGYDDPLYGWGNGLTAGVDVQQLSSYPAGMLVEPFVAELAEKLKACLENACAKQGGAAAPV